MCSRSPPGRERRHRDHAGRAALDVRSNFHCVDSDARRHRFDQSRGRGRAHHERHAGVGQSAHGGSRSAEGDRRHPSPDHGSVPHRGNPALGAGAVAGLIVGFAVDWVVGRIYPALPLRPPSWAVVLAIVTAIASGVVFGLMPARRAARLDPVEALGQEMTDGLRQEGRWQEGRWQEGLRQVREEGLTN